MPVYWLSADTYRKLKKHIDPSEPGSNFEDLHCPCDGGGGGGTGTGGGVCIGDPNCGGGGGSGGGGGVTYNTNYIDQNYTTNIFEQVSNYFTSNVINNYNENITQVLTNNNGTLTWTNVSQCE